LSLFTHFSGNSFAAILLSVMPHQLYLQVDASITGLDRPLGIQEFEAARISIQPKHEVGKVVIPTLQL
jgi:hypothetical protein